MHIIVGLNVGGAELMLERLISFDSGSQRRHRVVSLIGLQTVGQRMLAAGIPVESLNVRRPWHLFGAIVRLWQLIRKERPDVVQTWMYHADLIGGLAARLAGCRNVVWNVRTNALPRSAFKLQTRLLQRLCAMLGHLIPQRIITASRDGLNSHVGIGYPGQRMLAIGNGFVIPAQEHLDAARPRIRKEWGLTPEDCSIGMVARFHPAKGHQNFIRAAGKIADALPHATFFIIGLGCDPGNAVLRRWVQNAGLEGRIHLMGERDDVVACLAALDVFCLASLVEGFPNALGEAMAAGKACVATAVGSAREMLDGHGLLVPVADAPALAEAMASLCRMTFAQRKALGQAARQHVIDTYGMEHVLARYAELYNSLTGTSPNAAHSQTGVN